MEPNEFRAATRNAKPSTRVTSQVNLAIPNAVNTALTFNAARWNRWGQWAGANPTRLTANVAGLYDIAVRALLEAANDYTALGIWLLLNGATTIGWERIEVPVVAYTPSLHCYSTYYLEVGEYVEAIVWQANALAAARNILTLGNYSPEFWMNWHSRR